MEMLGNRRTQGAAASFDQKRVRIINIMLNLNSFHALYSSIKSQKPKYPIEDSAH